MESQHDALPPQRRLRGPWRTFVDRVDEHRAALHRYCLRLTGNVWDGEDLVQETLMRVFCTLARTDQSISNPRAYLVRTATHLWIDKVRRNERWESVVAAAQTDNTTAPLFDEPDDNHEAIESLFRTLHPQERAALVMKEVLDMSLTEISAALDTTVGAVKSALSRARGRLDSQRPPAGFQPPPKEIVEQFMQALVARDVDAIGKLCAENVVGELVGGAELNTFKSVRKVFEYAHMVMPRLGFGEKPWWKVASFDGETILLGFRTLDYVEGLNEVHRLQVVDGRIVRIRIYCFCPETLAVVAESLGCRALSRPHRSPGLLDVLKALIGFKPRWRSTPSTEQRPRST